MLPEFARSRFARFSDHVVYSSSLYADLRSQMTQMGSALIDFSKPPRTEADQACLELARALRPVTIASPLVRIGGDADGGYVMAEIGSATTAISIGVGHDVSWDRAMAERGCIVHMFDPTVAGPPVPVPNGVFHPIGLGSSKETAAGNSLDLRPLTELAHLAAPTNEALVLKIDAEGAEWECLTDEPDLSRFEQIVIELHALSGLNAPSRAASMLAAMCHLTASHTPIHLHGNNDADCVDFGAFWLPDVREVSLVRNDLAGDTTPSTDLRSDLDRPSNPRFADVSVDGILSA